MKRTRDPTEGQYLTTVEASRYLKLSRSTLAKMRSRGDGPPFIKAGPKVVLYFRPDADTWLASRRRQSTAET